MKPRVGRVADQKNGLLGKQNYKLLVICFLIGGGTGFSGVC